MARMPSSAYRQAREAGRPFDAVILDLMVDAGWGGEQTLVELPETRSGGEGPGLQRFPGRAEAHYEKQGFRGVIGKPYSLADLREAVEAVLSSPERG